MIKLYGYKNCSTCRKAESFFKTKKLDYEYIDVTLNPPSATNLKKMLKLSGEKVNKFLNTSGQVYREMKLKDKLAKMSDDDVMTLLSQNGKLIKRPLVTDGKTVTLGWRDEQSQTWK